MLGHAALRYPDHRTASRLTVSRRLLRCRILAMTFPVVAAPAVPTPEYSPDELTELLSGLMPDIPGYQVTRLIGRGGMSYVYLGVQLSLDRQVAIKVIRPDALKDEVSKLRFEKEARTIAKLQHPCIVGIHEVGRTEQGLLYYVMPYLSRGHVGQRDLTANEPRVFEVLRALLWALEYAHLRGVVHRDVKAENVLFDNADRPVLADFGIAIRRRDRSRITATGFAVGSSPHMAPEQARSENVDGRADLYSLGVLAFELVSGRLPFQSDDPLGLALMHAVDPVPPLPSDRQHWQAFIERAMAKRPEDRYADAHQMMVALDAVEAAAKRPVTGPRPVVANKGPSWRQRVRDAAGAALDRRRRSVALPPRAWIIGVATTVFVVVLLAAGWPAWRAASRVDAKVASTPSQEAAASVPIGDATRDDADAAVAVVAGSDADTASGIPDEPVASDEGAGSVDAGGAREEAAEPVALAPGVRELEAARRQIVRRRLTQPAGDNALESLRAAHRLDAGLPRLPGVGKDWLLAIAPYISDALASGNDALARALYQHADVLAAELQLRDAAAWKDLQARVVAPLLARLRAALDSGDVQALRAVKAGIGQWGLATAPFEPWWSGRIVTVQPGDTLGRAGSAALVVTRLPAAKPGLAVAAHAVTRDDYAAFATATSRPPSACRIRTKAVTLKRRTWQSPGFAQRGDHPVVCVSADDARAYADWLGARDGVRYRLPSVGEWQAVADHPSAASACADGRLACAGEGSRAAAAGPLSSAGVHVLHGNVREWPADCRPGCRRHPVLGLGWRDDPGRPSRDDDEVDPRNGYDDVGFRLVRDIARDEIETS